MTHNKEDEYFLLGNWCGKIRQHRRSYEFNKTLEEDADPNLRKKVGQITEDTIRRLDEIGFDWGYKAGVPPPKMKKFDDWMDEMVAFKEIHGHCNVPSKRCATNQYSSLANWCYRIRLAFRLRKEVEADPENEQLKAKQKKGHVLDEEMWKRLEDIGFEFEKMA